MTRRILLNHDKYVRYLRSYWPHAPQLKIQKVFGKNTKTTRTKTSFERNESKVWTFNSHQTRYWFRLGTHVRQSLTNHWHIVEWFCTRPFRLWFVTRIALRCRRIGYGFFVNVCSEIGLKTTRSVWRNYKPEWCIVFPKCARRNEQIFSHNAYSVLSTVIWIRIRLVTNVQYRLKCWNV